jgi:DNA-binding MarR family transcriptional regulator
MNNISTAINEELLRYQAKRLQDLIAEMLRCCEDRKLYESGRFGLPYSELKVLMLFDGERYLTVKGIAQKLEVAKSRVTKLIDGLRNKGLVEEIEDPKDARVKLISLTPKGQRKSKEIGALQQELHRKILLQMDPEERKHMLSYLELLRSAMEAVKEELTWEASG